MPYQWKSIVNENVILSARPENCRYLKEQCRNEWAKFHNSSHTAIARLTKSKVGYFLFWFIQKHDHSFPRVLKLKYM